MLTEEKQKLIDAKDWNALKDTAVLNDFNYNHVEWIKYTLNKEFMLEFLIDKTIVHEAHVAAANIAGNQVYKDDIWKHTLESYYVAGINFTVDEWKKIIDYVVTDKDWLDKDTLAIIVRYSDKSSGFYKMILDDKYYDVLSEMSKQRDSHAVSKNPFYGMTNEEVKIILPRLKYKGKIKNVSFYDMKGGPTALGQYFDSADEAIKFAAELNINIGLILSYLEPDEFHKWFLENATPEKMNSYLVEQASIYYKNKRGVDIPDEVVERFISMRIDWNTDKLDNLVWSLSEEQIVKHIEELDFLTVAQRKDISIGTIATIYPNMDLVDLSRSRFAKEEEIKQHPEFFNPQRLKNYASMYVSKETFKLLNKTWSKRQRYNEDLVSFKAIILQVIGGDTQLDEDILTYLIEKTGATNEQICDTFIYAKRKITEKTIADDLKPLIEITRFLSQVS